MARFAELCCRVSRGPSAGSLVQLRPWQRSILDELFELRADGLRRYRRGLLGMPRKNGKSLLGSVLALYALFADGEAGAEVYSVAGTRRQAHIVFDEARRMVAAEPELARLAKVYRDAIEVPATNSIYRALSSEAGAQEGLNPSFVVFDEVHVQPSDDLWDVMTLGSGTRSQPLTLGITTAGHDQDSLCYRLYDYGRRVASGEVDDPSFFFRWWEPHDGDRADWQDPGVWRESNPGLGDFLSVEDMEVASRQTAEHAFRRYRLNQWTTVRSSWLPAGVWDAAADPGRRVEPGEPVVLAFDGAWTNDCTALVGCTVDDPHLFTLGLWESPPDDPHWRVPIAEVEAAIVAACERWRPVEVCCDPFRWQRSLQELEGLGVPVVEFPNTPARMTKACQRIYDALVAGDVTHDGDAAMARHVANAVVRTDRAGSRIVKETKSSRRKIDLAVAAVMAFETACVHAGPGPSVWSMADLLAEEAP